LHKRWQRPVIQKDLTASEQAVSSDNHWAKQNIRWNGKK
jgi:hypothetical protein